MLGGLERSVPPPQHSFHHVGGGNSSVSLALITDTHYWPASSSQERFSRFSGAQPERDGLLVHRTGTIVPKLMTDLAAFAARGGAAAVHVGDAGCGGGGFDQPPAEHAASLRLFRELEVTALPSSWPVHHIPGNHDVSPGAGGLAAWHEHLGDDVGARRSSSLVSVGAAGAAAEPASRAYRALHVGRHWRLLLLDSMDGVTRDVDGHGHISASQLAWLDLELQAAVQRKQHVCRARTRDSPGYGGSSCCCSAVMASSVLLSCRGLESRAAGTWLCSCTNCWSIRPGPRL
jgi:3',5'-cyclic AMP phosphodiesterase CpdA